MSEPRDTSPRTGTGTPSGGRRSEAPPSKVERAKEASRRLRGTVGGTVTEPGAVHFGADDVQILKFHGIYQQDDRDARLPRRRAGADKAWEFMVRVRIPGGRVTASQWRAIDTTERRLEQGRGLRLTSRQAVQFHGLLKGDLGPLLRDLDETLMTTLGACGDVGRNVMVSPAPVDDHPHRVARRVASTLARTLELRTGAYREIWLDGERVGDDAEPLYGETYLPRKFKVGVTVAGENEIDVYTQDVGLVVVDHPRGEAGVGVLVGGGLGMTHRREDTFARLASPLGWVPEARAAAVVRAVVELFRDHGERSDRRHARLKYLVEEWGTARFRDLLEERLEAPLEPWIDPGPFAESDLLGTHPQGDGRWFHGIQVPHGRLLDVPDGLRAAVRRIAEEVGTDFVITPTQNLLVADLDRPGVHRVVEILAAHGAPDPESLSGLRRYAMACPALPTCGLALADAERVLPEVLADLEPLLTELGVEREALALRMTGCPNGCVRPYSADLGLVGRSPGVYDLYVGGGLAGDRLGELYEEKVPRAEIVTVLRPLLVAWSRERRPGESLGRYYRRLRPPGPEWSLRRGSKEPTRGSLELPEPDSNLVGAAVGPGTVHPRSS